MVTNNQEGKYELYVEWVENGQKRPLFYKDKNQIIHELEKHEITVIGLMDDCNVYFSYDKNELQNIETTVYDIPLFCTTYEQKMNILKEYIRLVSDENYSPYYVIDTHNIQDIVNFDDQPLDILIKWAKNEFYVFIKEQ